MDSNNGPHFSVTNLIYVFPAAIWVNQTAGLVQDTPRFFALYVAFVFFAFLPAEIYATELWERVRSDRAAVNVRFWGTLINMTGVFSLSLFYLAYPNLDTMYQGGASLQKGAVLCLGLGLLLFMNGLWNAVERPRHVEVFGLSAEAAARRAQKMKGIRKAIYAGIARSMPAVRRVNFSLFAFISPATGLGLAFIAGLAVIRALPDAVASSHRVAHSLSLFVAVFMTIITSFKILHAYLLTTTFREID